ncbi:DUF333 domain-containing protein [Bdellovibrio sp. NC01]|uniref:DUF333 domain-containing protein n=1 Tax=Bdellovibrio sp. NC01 TaxID=2220073 RepID=UPI001157D14F|nr:DUF333 domain-containing protein [Bdellovibrio sp. NC01]QDK38016.1 DUF333 domain-containing protein [Bdellovibrio sp. NC01]
MRTLLIAFTLLLSSQSFAQTSLNYYENEKYREVKISEYQGAKIGADCIKSGKPSCQAWTAYTGKPATESTKPNTTLAGNPAAQYCWDLKAKNRILKEKDGKQYDYCVFEDGSMIDSWTLYYKHFPKK